MYNTIIYRKNRGKKISLLVLMILFTVSLVVLYNRYSYVLFYGTPNYNSLIADSAKKYYIDPLLLKAVIWHESKFDPNALGKKGEIGLMQIRPEHGAASDWAEKNKVELPCPGLLARPELNIEIGAWYLAKALYNWEEYKYQYELALSEYNAGRTGMKPWVPNEFDGKVVENITIPSTKEYVKSVMKKYQRYTERR